MTIKSIFELLADADTLLADNTSGAISAADVRTLIKDFIDTMSPAYGSINAPSIVQTLTASPVSLKPFTQQLAATVGYFTTNLTMGTVTRLVNTAGIAGATNFVITDGIVEGSNGDQVTIALYRNGAYAGYSSSVECLGAGNKVGFNIAAIDYVTSDAVYDIRVSGGAGSKTFTEVTLVLQAQPVRSYV